MKRCKSYLFQNAISYQILLQHNTHIRSELYKIQKVLVDKKSPQKYFKGGFSKQIM